MAPNVGGRPNTGGYVKDMETIEEHILDHAAALSVVVDESREFPDSDFQESDEFGSTSEPQGESVSTDDPVRVYLREMGSVSLLKRQGEIDLARRMERGKLRMQKALRKRLRPDSAAANP